MEGKSGPRLSPSQERECSKRGKSNGSFRPDPEEEPDHRPTVNKLKGQERGGGNEIARRIGGKKARTYASP